MHHLMLHYDAHSSNRFRFLQAEYSFTVLGQCIACGELTRTFCNCAAVDGLETGMGGNLGRRRDSAIPGPCFSWVGRTALRSVMGK
jgi:hypothetical protein